MWRAPHPMEDTLTSPTEKGIAPSRSRGSDWMLTCSSLPGKKRRHGETMESVLIYPYHSSGVHRLMQIISWPTYRLTLLQCHSNCDMVNPIGQIRSTPRRKHPQIRSGRNCASLQRQFGLFESHQEFQFVVEDQLSRRFRDPAGPGLRTKLDDGLFV